VNTSDLPRSSRHQLGGKRELVWFLCAALIVAFVFISTAAMRKESPCADEVAHLSAGVTYWEKLDMRLNLEHPPLLKLIAGGFAKLAGAHGDYETPSWRDDVGAQGAEFRYARDFFDVWNRPRVVGMVQTARFGVLAFSTLLAITIFLVARYLSGDWGALVSLGLFVTAPYFLSLGPLLLNDLLLAWACLLALWCFARVQLERTRRACYVWGFCTGLALLAKYSALLLFVSFILSEAWNLLRPIGPTRGWKEVGNSWVRGCAVALAVTFVVMAAFSWNTPVARLWGQSSEGYRLLAWLAPLQQHTVLRHVVLPSLLYAKGVYTVAIGLTRTTILWGKHYPKGTHAYFPTVFLLKMTPAFLASVLLLLGLALKSRILKNHASQVRQDGKSLVIRNIRCGLIVFAVAAIQSSIGIGLRHISVPVVLLVVLLSEIAPLAAACGSDLAQIRIWQAVSCVLVAASFFSCVLVFPDYIPYFNVFASSKSPYLVASENDVDCGQGLPTLKTFVDERHLSELRLDYLGNSPRTLDPRVYVPEAIPWNCSSPPTDQGWVGVSSDRLGNLDPEGRCGWLFGNGYRALAGGSIYVFWLGPRSEQATARNGGSQ